jgi:hypothetical protein
LDRLPQAVVLVLQAGEGEVQQRVVGLEMPHPRRPLAKHDDFLSQREKLAGEHRQRLNPP